MSEEFDFEKALEALNTIVVKMEQGELPLKDSIEQFETAMALTKDCFEALNKAEQKVQILLEKNGELKLHDYQPEE